MYDSVLRKKAGFLYMRVHTKSVRHNRRRHYREFETIEFCYAIISTFYLISYKWSYSRMIICVGPSGRIPRAWLSAADCLGWKLGSTPVTRAPTGPSWWDSVLVATLDVSGWRHTLGNALGNDQHACSYLQYRVLRPWLDLSQRRLTLLIHNDV